MGQVKEARQLYEELLPITQGSPWYTEAYLRWVALGRDLPAENTNAVVTALPGSTSSEPSASGQTPGVPQPAAP